MNVYVIVALSVLTQMGLKGSKMLVALHAIDLGASPLAIGLLIALYSVFPMQLALFAGRVCDRSGVRRPMVLGSLGISAGLLVPAIYPHLAGLYVSAIIIGSATIFYQVSAQYTVGALGEGMARTRNFSVYSLGGSISGFIGPLLVGYAMEGAGKLAIYGALAAIAAIPALVLLALRRIPMPRHQHGVGAQTPSALRLLANPDLKRAFMTSAVILTGLDLFNFYMPIYGRSLGFTPSTIGIILSMQAAAAFIVRLFLPRLVQRAGDERVLRWALLLAGGSYLAFPLASHPFALAGVAFVMGLSLGCGQPLTMQLT